MAITVTGSVVVDETTGAQTNGSTGVADATGNELIFGAAGTPAVPAAFSAALVAVADGVPTTGALSGFSTTATTGVNIIDYGGALVSGVAFVDVNGDPMDGVDSGLRTTDGTKIFLYTYSGNNNVLFGVKGNDNGTPGDPTDDFAVDPETVTTQPIVFAAYLDEGATGAKVWLVQYESMFHTTPGSTAAAYDEPVSPANVIYIALDQLTPFSLEGAPSGQNLFLMFGTPGDGNAANGDEVAIVVTAKNPAAGNGVNTGQGGGGTTLGSNNQMLDPGEGLIFTFVTNAVADFTVPLLDQNEADVAGNIQFGGVFGSTEASFKVVQTQPNSKSSTLTISAFLTAAESGSSYIPGLTGDTHVDVLSVVVKNAAGVILESEGPGTGGVDGAAPLDIQFNVVNSGLPDEYVTATVIGVKAGYTIEYTTDGLHNRVGIDNTGVSNTRTGADFDIGGFALPGTTTTQLPFNALVFQDDGPSAGGTAQTDSVDEDGLTGGNPGGPGDLAVDNLDGDGNEATTSGSVAAIFDAGADGLLSYGLSNDPARIALLPALTSQGGTVEYDVTGTTLTAYVDDGTTADYQSAEDREVFTLGLTAATGAYTFTLLDQLDHPLTDNPATPAVEISYEDELVLNLGAILQVTEGDIDTATASADKLAITVDDDSPEALSPGDITVHNAPGGFATAALGYAGQVGADEPGTVQFTGGTDGDILQGTIQDGTPALENLLFGGLPIKLYGFGTDTLTATTDITDPADTVFVMTLDPVGDVYDITMNKTIANTQDVDFGSFVAKVASGNPLFKVIENIGGSPVDALFSGWLVPSGTQETVNIATVGVGVGNGQDFNAGDRMQIQFLQDDGALNSVVTDAEEQTVNRFTFVMNQNNPPQDDGDLIVRAYDSTGSEVQITGILINGETLVGAGGAPVESNDQEPDPGTEFVTANANGLGYDLHGLGGGTGGSAADNDTVTVITADGYVRVDLIATGADTNKDTFDILLKSVAIPVSYDINFSVNANLSDEDGDTTASASLDVTLDADGVFVTTVGVPDLVV